MENKKIIKAIKKAAFKQFQEDLKNSVIKELYSGSFKKDIDEIKQKILQEMQDDLFNIIGVDDKAKFNQTSSEFLNKSKEINFPVNMLDKDSRRSDFYSSSVKNVEESVYKPEIEKTLRESKLKNNGIKDRIDDLKKGLNKDNVKKMILKKSPNIGLNNDIDIYNQIKKIEYLYLY